METQHHTTKQNPTQNLQHKFKTLECQHGAIKQNILKNKARKKSLKQTTQQNKACKNKLKR